MIAMPIELEVNGKRYPVHYDPDTPLLYVLRDELGLAGTKYGCGGGQLHPVQHAFLDAGAFQCAYCTPGIIMSSVGLLQVNANPSSAEIVQFLQGNICRCGAHPRIVDAVQQAAKSMQERV